MGAKLAGEGFTVDAIEVRDLQAEDLLLARPTAPALSAALGLVEQAQGVVIATPIYKAAYFGVLKAFLDLMPQFGLDRQGGAAAGHRRDRRRHVLAIDYALRPVLTSLNPLHVVSGLFLAEKQLERTDGGLVIDPEMAKWLDRLVADFVLSVRRAQSVPRPAGAARGRRGERRRHGPDAYPPGGRPHPDGLDPDRAVDDQLRIHHLQVPAGPPASPRRSTCTGPQDQSTWGLFLSALGTASMIVGLLQYRQVVRELGAGRFGLTGYVAGAVLALGVVVSLGVITRMGPF